MFACHPQKKTVSKRSVWHFSRIAIINIFLLFALIVASCVPVRETPTDVQEVVDAPALLEVQKPDDHTPPIYERPQPRVGKGSSNDIEETPPNQRVGSSYPAGASSLLFVENVGQFESKTQFQVQAPTASVSLSNDEILLTFFEPIDIPALIKAQTREIGAGMTPHKILDIAKIIRERKKSEVKITFPQANPNAQIVGFDALDMPVSFVQGDESFTNVPVWSGVRYVDIYPGADLEITGRNGQWVWQFVVRDNRLFYSTKNVLIRRGLIANFSGQTQLAISDGILNVSTEAGNFDLPLIQAIQSGSQTLLSENPKLDGDKLQIISPQEMKPDRSSSPSSRGMGVLAAPRKSLLAPVFGQFTNENAGHPLLYSTLVEFWPAGIATDSDGRIYITGLGNNYTEAFVARIDPNGDSDYLIFLGEGVGYGIAAGTDGSAYVTGDASIGGESFAFVKKIDPLGTNVSYAQHFNSDGVGQDIAVDNIGAAYITGIAGDEVNFVVKLDPSGNNFVYTNSFGDQQGVADLALGVDGSVYIGGYGIWKFNPSGAQEYSLPVPQEGNLHSTWIRSIAVDLAGFAYATDEYRVLKVSPSGSITTIYDEEERSTPGLWNTIGALAVDEEGLIYIAEDGIPGTGHPITAGAFSTQMKGDSDLLIEKMNSEGVVVAGTYLGGSAYDGFFTSSYGTNMAVDNDGNIYIAGWTTSSDFPTSIDADYSGSFYFVSKLPPPPDVPNMSVASGCGGDGIGCALRQVHEREGGPIDTLTGGHDFSVVDLSIPTSAGPLVFTRDYSSMVIDSPTSLSPGWTFSHDIRLIMPDDPGGVEGEIRLKAHTANQYIFYALRDHLYAPAAGLHGQLVYEPGPPVRFRVTDSAQNSYLFDQEGTLLSYENSTGNGWEYTYDTSGRLTRVSADGGTRYLALDYDGQGRLASVSDSDQEEKSVSYEYDPSGDLTSATDVLEQEWTYTYVANHLLEDVLDPDGNIVEHTEYDAQGRAVRQDNGEGPVVEITYGPDGTTTIDDALGNTTTHVYNERGEIVSETDAVGGETGRTSNFNFRPFIVTDALGNTTDLNWSDDGVDLEYIRDALDHEAFISYNSFHQPTSVTDLNGYKTKYEYNDPDFPTLPTRIEYPLSFDEGATYIHTDYEYYPLTSGASAGKVKYVTDMGGETYYTYTSSGQVNTVTTAHETPNEQMTDYDYDDLGRLIKVTDPSGVITRYKYDDADRLTVMITNVNPDTPNEENPPQNLVSGDNIYNLYTRYYYDPRGNQIAVVDTDWNIARTYYDRANRQVGAVQNLVINGIPADSDDDVLIAIDAPLESIPAYNTDQADWNIRTDTEYDGAGNVIVARDSQGVITRTYYDEVNRPKLVIQNWSGTDLYGDISTAPAYSPTIPDQNVRTEYFYDLNGNLIATKDTHGMITRTYYDALNRPKAVVQNLTGQDIAVETLPERGTSSNILTEMFYDANGNVIATRDPRGVWTRTYYDALNRPVVVVQNLIGKSYTDPDLPRPGLGECGSEANICSFTYYDQAGNAIATVDPRGMVTRTYYDEANRPYATVRNLSGQDIYATTPPERGVSVNVRTDIAYAPNGRRDTTTDPAGRVTKYEYNHAGELLQTTVNYVNGGEPQNGDDQRNIITRYAYDALGRQIRTTDTLGRITLTAYDDLGRVTSVTRNYQQGQPQNYKDASGNQYNLITTYSYDVRSNQIAITDTAGVVTRTYYDALARPVAVVRNLVSQDIAIPFPPVRANPPSSFANLRTDTVYLGTGSVDSVIDEAGEKTEYSYDALGQLTTSMDPFEKSTSFAYDANGNRTLMIDANGIATRYEYDPLNRLTAVVENYISVPETADQETNVRTSYTYDAGGNRLSIRDGQSHLEEVDYRTLFTYDAFGRLETETDPLGNTSTYGYDAMGNRTSLLDANEATTMYGYDELNRLVLIDYPDPDTDVTFDYDPLGRRTSMTDGLGTTTWEHNNLDLPNSITDPFAASVSYGYDEVGNRTSLTYPGNTRTVNYEYNDVHRLTTVISDQSSVASYTYDAVGRVTMVERANGVDTAYNYYDNGWLQNITHASGIEVLASYEYEYDHVGNRTQAIEEILVPGISGGAMLSRPSFTNTLADNESDTEFPWNKIQRDSAFPELPTSKTTLDEPVIPDLPHRLSSFTLPTEADLEHLAPDSRVMEEKSTSTSEDSNAPDLPPMDQLEGSTVFTDENSGTRNESPSGTMELDSSDIFGDGFESGDLSAWSWAETNGGNLSVSTQAAAVGTYGMQVLVDDTEPMFAYDATPFREKQYNARFYFDPNSIEIPDGQGFPLFAGMDANGDWVTYLHLERQGGYYRLWLVGIDDAHTVLWDEPMYITDAWQAVEIEWQAASAPDADDGYVKLFVNDVLSEQIEAMDTDERALDTVVLGTQSSISATGTLYFDAFESRRYSHIGLDPNGPAVEPPPAPPDFIFGDGFESGDLSAWSWAETNGGNLSVSTQAAAVGTYGMQVLVDDTEPMFAYDATPFREKQYNARFYFDPNSIEFPDEHTLLLFTGIGADGDWVTCLYLERQGDYYRLWLGGIDDSHTVLWDEPVYITDAWQAVEIEWQAASASDADDGYVKLFVNDVLSEQIEAMDTDERALDTVVLGTQSSISATGTLYFDAFESRRYSHIGLDPNGPAVEPPPAPPDFIFGDGFESDDLSAWSWAETNGGNLSVSTQAAGVGTYGMQVLVDDTEPMFVYDATPFREKQYNARFYFDPNSIEIPDGQGFPLFAGMDADGDWVTYLHLERQGGYYRLWLVGIDDAHTVLWDEPVYITDAWQAVEIEWQASSAPDADDGYVKLFVNDVLSEQIEAMDTDERALDTVVLGTQSSISATGTLYFDAFESRRYSHIGLVPQTWSVLSQTIRYDYDPLYRLTAADYISNGDYYHYTYDAVGNRKTQTSMLSGLLLNTTYDYDDANRLIGVNGVPYTWDGAGNLLNDGVNTYTYDSANRLKTVTGPSVAASYGYRCNGESIGQFGCESDRVSQTVNGVTTNYVLDSASPLTQVLQDGTNTYVYGVDRIAQMNGAVPEYFLTDGLGSVRQLLDSSGAVILAKKYDPYGTETGFVGSGLSSYGFTGEMTDPTGLLYLRARYYESGMGRFLTRDTWEGDINSPMSFNRWMYVEGNPVTYVDPSGHIRTACVIDTSGDGWTGRGWTNDDIKKRVDEAEKYVYRTSDPMDTYVAAGIAIQCAGNDEPRDYSGQGIAQITPKQAETEWGVEIKDIWGRFRGYGLRCEEDEVPLDPNNTKDAVVLMKREIQIVWNECNKNCTETDKYIVAALSQNGPGFSYMELRQLPKMDKKEYKLHAYVPDIRMNWFLRWRRDAQDGDMVNTKTQLNRFILVVNELQRRRWVVPYIDSNTINELKNW